jgi:hypothetical protein
MEIAVRQFFTLLVLAVGLGLGGVGGSAYAQSSSAAPQAKSKERVMAFHASGIFEVKLLPQALADSGADPTLGRITIAKTFSGDPQGTSKGEMLTAMTPVTGSAGYVAIERVSGTLQGRSGTFALHHMGTMNRGAPQLLITVVPDSGTGDLVGLAGTLDIKIVDGKHFYTFDYGLPEKE